MAFFRKRISPTEFGAAVLETAHEWVVTDATRALASCYDGWLEAPANGQIHFFESKGVTKAHLRSYLRLVSHCSVHAMALQYEPNARKELVRGAMNGFSEAVVGYDFERVYSLLEGYYSGGRQFEAGIERLGDARAASIHFLPSAYQSAGIVNARFLLAEFIMPNLKSSKAVIDSFENFSMTICAIVGVVQRSASHVLQDVKL